MEELGYGPNGGLIFCLECDALFCHNFYRYLIDNIDWLEEDLAGFDDDFLIVDCPGIRSLRIYHQ